MESDISAHAKLGFCNHSQYNVGGNLLSDFYMMKVGIISFAYTAR